MLKRNIKFPLVMQDNVQVRTLAELIQAFHLESVMGYFRDGRLITWLEQRNYHDEAQQVAKLDPIDRESAKKLCDIFGVAFTESAQIEVEQILLKTEKTEKVTQITEDEQVLENIDFVARSQQELDRLLKEGATEIYLLGDNFKVRQKYRYVKYIGLNKPAVTLLTENKKFQARDNGIDFENVKLTATEKIRLIKTSLEKCAIDKNRVTVIPYEQYELKKMKASELIHLLKASTHKTQEKLLTSLQSFQLREVVKMMSAEEAIQLIQSLPSKEKQYEILQEAIYIYKDEAMKNYHLQVTKEIRGYDPTEVVQLNSAYVEEAIKRTLGVLQERTNRLK